MNKDEMKQKIEDAKVKVDTWWWNTKQDVAEKGRTVVNWASQNKELVVATTPVVLGIVAQGNRMINRAAKNKELRREERLKDLYIYDRSIGNYVKLRRPMTANEQIELAQRRASGEPLVYALTQMKLL